MTKHIQTDVLVIGGGGAGFRAAIGARKTGASVMLLSKGPLGRECSERSCCKKIIETGKNR
ncbi:MAG: hypothetical protein C0403_15075 [Desulfobacterium sp.]|nr:hypothetical protein [Desulfobacterium sp.]